VVSCAWVHAGGTHCFVQAHSSACRALAGVCPKQKHNCLIQHHELFTVSDVHKQSVYSSRPNLNSCRNSQICVVRLYPSPWVGSGWAVGNCSGTDGGAFLFLTFPWACFKGACNRLYQQGAPTGRTLHKSKGSEYEFPRRGDPADRTSLSLY